MYVLLYVKDETSNATLPAISRQNFQHSARLPNTELNQPDKLTLYIQMTPG